MAFFHYFSARKSADMTPCRHVGASASTPRRECRRRSGRASRKEDTLYDGREVRAAVDTARAGGVAHARSACRLKMSRRWKMAEDEKSFFAAQEKERAEEVKSARMAARSRPAPA